MALPPEEIAYQTEHIHEDQGPKIIGISVFLVVLAAGSVVLRFVARMVRHMELGWDDWLCVPALLLTGCMCTVNIICRHQILRTYSRKRVNTPPQL